MLDNVRNANPIASATPSQQGADWRDNVVFSEADTPNKRLMRLRIAAGYETALDAAHAIGLQKQTYFHHENGYRNISRQAALKYAEHFGVPAGLILYGEKPIVSIEVPVVGGIGRSGRIETRMDSHIALPRTTPAPPFVKARLEALVVTSSDLYPAYRPGDVVFYEAPGRINGAAIEGQECVVQTALGESLLAICHASTPGTWTLTGYNQPPLSGVHLRSASPVLWVQKNAYVLAPKLEAHRA